jgi:hypothetical protein
MRAFRPVLSAKASPLLSMPNYIQYVDNNNNSVDDVDQARGIVRRILKQQPDIRRRVLGPRLPCEAVDDVFELSEQLTNDPGVRRAFLDKWKRMREDNSPIVQKCMDLYTDQSRRLHASGDLAEIEEVDYADDVSEPGAICDEFLNKFDQGEDDRNVFDTILDWFVEWGDWVFSFFGASSESKYYDSRSPYVGYAVQTYQGPGYEDVSPSPSRASSRRSASSHHHYHRDGFDAVFEAAGMTSILVLIVVALMKILR